MNGPAMSEEKTTSPEVRKEYRDLIAAAAGHPPSPPPCFAFGVHKAGSTLMHNMLAAACQQAGVAWTNVPGVLFDRGIFEPDWQSDTALVPVFQAGGVHLGFRVFAPLLLDPRVQLSQRRSVLLLRDPRDALVSEFFSYGGQLSHVLPKENAEQLLQKVSQSRNEDIDTYCLRVARGYCAKIDTYRQALAGSNHREFRYEEVFFDKQRFLAEIFTHFGIAVDAGIVASVASKYDIRPAVEDPSKHIRKGYPGDFREKLQPSTVARLNEIFAAHRDLLGDEA
jgi:hypothetical protein